MSSAVSNQVQTSLGSIARKLASEVSTSSRPLSPQAHLVKGGKGTQLFLPNGSRLYNIDERSESYLASLIQMQDEEAIRFELIAMGLDIPARIDDQPLESPPLHALSLAIAQKCNMGCTYCYASQGDFGGPAKKMTIETARQAIDMLIDGRQAGERVQLTFLGGEPLMNRADLRKAVVYAADKGLNKGVKVNFSITTNGTLIRPEDAVFFEEYGFSVTVSLDGLKEQHNALRPFKNGQGSYDRITEKIQPLLKIQRQMQVSARVTVTPHNMNLAESLDDFIHMGFHSVGFSPLLNSSNGREEMSSADLELMLSAMIACGLKFEEAVLKGQRYPFLNMINALKEIDRGTHRPYPCGAGAGYMGVSAEGELAACHRFVNEPKGEMGNIYKGIDAPKQNSWLKNRHVHYQEPCNSCWARYLCGGGCHHEVIDKGRTACDYIRGWLHFTIQSYERINRLKPDWNQ